LDEYGNVKRIKVARREESIYVGETDPIPIFDASGNAVMVDVPDGFDEVAVLDESGNPVLELVHVRDDTIPRVDESGSPVMVPKQAVDASGNLVFSQELQLDESGNALTESYHTSDPETGALQYETIPTLDENGNVQYYEVEQWRDLPELDEQDNVIYETVVARDENGNELKDAVPLLDFNGEPVVVDGIVVHRLVTRYVQRPVMRMQRVVVYEILGERVPVMGVRDVYVSVPVWSEDEFEQAVDVVPVMESRPKMLQVARTRSVQKTTTLPMYRTRTIFEDVEQTVTYRIPETTTVGRVDRVALTTQVARRETVQVTTQVARTTEVPVTTTVARTTEVPVTTTVARTTEVPVTTTVARTEEVDRTVEEEYTVVDPDLDANGRYIWEIQLDESGDPINVPAYTMRYVDASGVMISREEYDTRKASDEPVFKCAFLGVVYMCG